MSILNDELTPYFAHLTFAEYESTLINFDGQTHIAAGAATQDGDPIALVLVAINEKQKAVLLSLFTDDAHQNQGVATQLLTLIHQYLAQLGIKTIWAEFRNDHPYFGALARVFEKCQWREPTLHLLVVEGKIRDVPRLRFVPEQPPAQIELFMWKDLQEQDIEAYNDLVDARDDSELFLSPFTNLGMPYHEETSVGARFHGKLVGWQMTHLVQDTPPTIRYSRLYVAKPYRKQNVVLFLLKAAIDKQLQWEAEQNIVSYAMLAAVARNPAIAKFARFLGKRDKLTYTEYVQSHYQFDTT